MAHLPWPVELGSKLTGVHGGTVPWLNVGRPAPAERWRGECLESCPVFVRCSCAQKGGEKEDGEGESMERSTPARRSSTPMSDSRAVKAYQGERTRAPAARW